MRRATILKYLLCGQYIVGKAISSTHAEIFHQLDHRLIRSLCFTSTQLSAAHPPIFSMQKQNRHHHLQRPQHA